MFGENIFLLFFPVHSSSHLDQVQIFTGLADGETLDGVAYARACEAEHSSLPAQSGSSNVAAMGRGNSKREKNRKGT